MKRKILSFSLIFAFLLPALLSGGLLFAPRQTSNPFSDADRAREALLEGSLGAFENRPDPFDPSVGNVPAGEGYIVRFSPTAPLSEVYEIVEPFSYTLLSGSENRLFLLYLNDADAFSRENADKLLYMEKDVSRTVRTTARSTASDGEVIPSAPSNEDDGSSESSDWQDAFTRWELAELGVYDALDVTDGSGVTVAVLDSGLDRSHSAFAGADIAAGYDAVAHRPGVDSDESGHGTKVTGILVARFAGDSETLGVSPGVSVYPIKVSEDGKTLYTSSLIYALHLAADAGVDVINMSLGGYSRSEAEADAVEYAHSRGCILVAAAGNEGSDKEYAGKMSYPASYDHVISVGAYGQDGLICSFSQYNDALDVVAPGDALTLVGNGPNGYVNDAGTSFACAYVSAAAALCRAVQPEGQALDGDELAKLLEYALGSARDPHYGYGKLFLPELLEIADGPVALGVSDGATYFSSVTIIFRRGTAELDGEPIFSGHTVYKSGAHTLTMTAGGKTRTVTFTMDTAALGYTYKEYDGYAAIEFSRRTATLDGFPYLSGEPITTDGSHIFVLTGPNGNSREYRFETGFSLPSVFGVTDGGVYAHPVQLRIAGAGRVLLDGEAVSGETVVSASGTHTLVLYSADGKRSKTLSFTLRTAVSEADLKYTDLHAILDEENGVFLTYLEGVSSLRIHSTDNLSVVKRSILLSAPVKAWALEGSWLLLFHEDSYTVLDRSKLLTKQDAKLGTFSLVSGVDDAVVYGGRIYYLSLNRLFAADIMQENASELLLETGSRVDCLSADASTGMLYLCDSLRSKTNIHTYDTAAGLPGELTTAQVASGRVTAQNGSLYFDNGVFSRTGECLRLLRAGKLLAVSGDYRLHEFGVFAADNTQTGVYGRGLAQVLVGSETVYLVYDDGHVASAPVRKGESYFGSAPPTVEVFGGLTENNIYTYMGSFAESARPAAFAAASDAFYLLFENDNRLYRFSASDFTLRDTAALYYMPSMLRSDGEALYVAFDGAAMLYEASSGRYWSIPVLLDDFQIEGKRVYGISGGRLCTFVLGEDAVRWIGETGAVRLALADDTVCVYVVGELLAYDKGSLALAARRSIQLETPLVAFGAYVAAGQRVYRANDLALQFDCGSIVLAWQGDSIICAAGLYSVRDKRLVASHPIGEALVLFTDGQDFYELSGSSLYVIKNRHNGEVSEPPVITSPLPDGEYADRVTLQYGGGTGYLDSKATRSGTLVSSGGTHTLLVIGAWGLSARADFTITPALTHITIRGGDKAVEQGGSITLYAVYHPDGASPVPVIFTSDSDCVTVTSSGRVTGVAPGRAVITARTADGRYTATCYIEVSENLLVHTGDYRVDRDTETVCITGEATAETLLAAFSVSKGTVRLQTASGEAVTSGLLGTGMQLVLVNSFDEVIDRLTVAVPGDLDGDGLHTVNDYVQLIRLLELPDGFSAAQGLAVDFNGNGHVSDNDLRDLRTELFRTGTDTRIDESRDFLALLSVPEIFYVGDTVTVMLAAYLGDDSAVDGILADVRFDPQQLTLQSVNPLNCTLESDISRAAEGEIRLLSHSKTGDGTVFAVLTFQISDDLEEGEQVGLVMTGASAAYDGVCRSSPERDYSRAARKPTGDESFMLRFPNAPVDFDPAVYEYDVLLPEDQPRLEIEADYAPGESVYIGETTVDPGLRRTISVIYTDRNGTVNVYTFRVWRRTAAQTDSTLSGVWLHGLPLKGFDKGTTAYTITVDAEFDSLGLTAEPSSDQSTVEINAPETLAYGENLVRITVTAYDGSTTVYTLTVIRAQPEEESPAESSLPAAVSTMTESVAETPDGFIFWPFALLLLAAAAGTTAVLLLRRRRSRRRAEEEYDEE